MNLPYDYHVFPQSHSLSRTRFTRGEDPVFIELHSLHSTCDVSARVGLSHAGIGQVCLTSRGLLPFPVMFAQGPPLPEALQGQEGVCLGERRDCLHSPPPGTF